MSPHFLLIFAILMAVGGIALWNEKAGFLVPAVKRADPEKTDIHKIYRVNAVEFLGIGFACLVMWLGGFFGSLLIRNLGLVLLLGTGVASLVYENRKGVFDKK